MVTNNNVLLKYKKNVEKDLKHYQIEEMAYIIFAMIKYTQRLKLMIVIILMMMVVYC